MESRRKFTKEFKLAAVHRLRAGEAGEVVARSLEVNRQDLYRWS
jgi:transposase-like protein